MRAPENDTHQPHAAARLVSLEARPERSLIRPGTSYRHVAFTVRVAPPSRAADRLPMTLALVLDRSGSMHGEKLVTAKAAAVGLLDRLNDRDRLAVIVFDNEVDTLQPLAPVTPALCAGVRRALRGIEPRGTTALHEAWLTGCRAVAADEAAGGSAVAHCFLLTDGLANEGETSSEHIAAQAADVRQRAGVGTSTFGVGEDYDESLLGPLAVAGGGQFTHLRSGADTIAALGGQLGELLTTAATQVRLEIEVEPGITAEIISAYPLQSVPSGQPRWSVAIGDLGYGAERPLVVRFGFPAPHGQEGRTVRVRLVWHAESAERQTEWQSIRFTYAEHAACDAEPRDPAAMHWVGLHHGYRAQLTALTQRKKGDARGARATLQETARRIAAYAGADAALHKAIDELHSAEQDQDTKERWNQAQRRARSQHDHRQPASSPDRLV